MDEELRPREEAVAEEKKERKEKEKLDWRKEFYSELRMLAVVLTVTILIFHFLTQLVVVVGSSMYPTLHEDDLLIAWRATSLVREILLCSIRRLNILRRR